LKDNPFLTCIDFYLKHPKYLGKQRSAFLFALMLNNPLGQPYCIPLIDGLKNGTFKLDATIYSKALTIPIREVQFLILLNVLTQFAPPQCFRRLFSKVLRRGKWTRRYIEAIAATLHSHCVRDRTLALKLKPEIQILMKRA